MQQSAARYSQRGVGMLISHQRALPKGRIISYSEPCSAIGILPTHLPVLLTVITPCCVFCAVLFVFFLGVLQFNWHFSSVCVRACTHTVDRVVRYCMNIKEANPEVRKT